MSELEKKGLKPERIMMDSIHVANVWSREAHGDSMDVLNSECKFIGPETIRTRTWKVGTYFASFCHCVLVVMLVVRVCANAGGVSVAIV